MYQEKNIAIDHGNRNMKTENLIFTSGLTVSEKQPPFGDYMSYQGKYYADWYIGLYMLINGLLYSSIGSWLGYKVGIKLQQVMGE